MVSKCHKVGSKRAFLHAKEAFCSSKDHFMLRVGMSHKKNDPETQSVLSLQAFCRIVPADIFLLLKGLKSTLHKQSYPQGVGLCFLLSLAAAPQIPTHKKALSKCLLLTMHFQIWKPQRWKLILQLYKLHVKCSCLICRLGLPDNPVRKDLRLSHRSQSQ